MSIYKGVFEASVYTVDDDGEPIEPYYNREVLKKYVTTYFDESIKKYTTDYKLNFIFYKNKSDLVAEQDEYSRKVKISLNANINYLFKFNKEQCFSIIEKEELWTKD